MEHLVIWLPHALDLPNGFYLLQYSLNTELEAVTRKIECRNRLCLQICQCFLGIFFHCSVFLEVCSVR